MATTTKAVPTAQADTAPAEIAPAEIAPADTAPVAASVTETLRLGHGAVLRAIEGNTVNVPLPLLGTVRLPPLDSLAWFGGLAALAAVGLLEWPVAAAVGVGHLLVQQQHFRLLHDFGEALEEA